MSDHFYSKDALSVMGKMAEVKGDLLGAFMGFNMQVFAEGALDARTKQIIAVAVAHVTQCPWCIEGHVKAARRAGATQEQIMEAIWVAAEMRAGAAFAHSIKALGVMEEDAAG